MAYLIDREEAIKALGNEMPYLLTPDGATPLDEKINIVCETIASDIEIIKALPLVELEQQSKGYEYHYDHTDCIWYRVGARVKCPVTCSQYRDGWNDAMRYIFKDGEGYKPYKRGDGDGE